MSKERCPECKTTHPKGWACPRWLRLVQAENRRLRARVAELTAMERPQPLFDAADLDVVRARMRKAAFIESILKRTRKDDH